MEKLFAPSLLRALVSRNVLVSVLALVVLVAVAIYESNQLILSQFADESGILADVALNEINDQADLAQRAATLVAGLPTTRELTELPVRVREFAELRARIVDIVSHVLEIGPDDVELVDGAARVKGDPAVALTLREVARIEEVKRILEESTLAV